MRSVSGRAPHAFEAGRGPFVDSSLIVRRSSRIVDPEIAPTASKSVADQSRRKVTLTDVRTGTGLP